jgi:hypothetical protein
MRCKIVRTQKLMWRNIMRSTKNKKVSVLHYSINFFKITSTIIYFSNQSPNNNKITLKNIKVIKLFTSLYNFTVYHFDNYRYSKVIY